MFWFLHTRPRSPLAALLLSLAMVCTLSSCSERASTETVSVIDGEDSDGNGVGDAAEGGDADEDTDVPPILHGECDFWPGPRPQLHDRFGFTIPFSHDVTLEEQDGGTLFWNTEKGIQGYVVPLPGRYEDPVDASTEALTAWAEKGVAPTVEFSRREAWDELEGVLGTGFLRQPLSAEQFIATVSGLDTSSLPWAASAPCDELRWTVQIGLDEQGTAALLVLAECAAEFSGWGMVHLQDWSGAGGAIRPVCHQEEIGWPVGRVDLLVVVDNSRSMAGEQQHVAAIIEEIVQGSLDYCENDPTCDARIAVTSTEAFLLNVSGRSDELAHDEWLDSETGLRGDGFLDELDGEAAESLAQWALEDPGCVVDGWPELAGANACGALDEDPYSSILAVNRRLEEDKRLAFSWREDARKLTVVLTDEPSTLHSAEGQELASGTAVASARLAELKEQLHEAGFIIFHGGYVEWPSADCEWGEGDEPVLGGRARAEHDVGVANSSGGATFELCQERFLDLIITGPVGEPAVTLTLERPLNVSLQLQIDGDDWSERVIQLDFEDRLLLWNYPDRNGAIAEVGYWQWVER